MKVIPNASLRPYHTFGFDVSANYLVIISGLEDLPLLFGDPTYGHMFTGKDGWLVMGEGSNILFTRDFDGMIILIRIQGIHCLKEDERWIYLQVGAGENWHAFVRHSLSMGWGGLENLSLIPGSVGAAPVQNIGAYGVEVESFIMAVEVYDVMGRSMKTISHFECMFGYRDSLFKRLVPHRFIITGVLFRLEKDRKPVLDYAPLRDHFTAAGIADPTLTEVSDAVIGIRNAKLPDPSLIGNAGSFFKNPVIGAMEADRLVIAYPQIPHFPADECVKVPAGWLIEQCGWKGYRAGAVGCHHQQALVLVHFGGGRPAELLALARRIRASVAEKFSIQLEPEVNIVGEQL